MAVLSINIKLGEGYLCSHMRIIFPANLLYIARDNIVKLHCLLPNYLPRVYLLSTMGRSKGSVVVMILMTESRSGPTTTQTVTCTSLSAPLRSLECSKALHCTKQSRLSATWMTSSLRLQEER